MHRRSFKKSKKAGNDQKPIHPDPILRPQNQKRPIHLMDRSRNESDLKPTTEVLTAPS